jgi:hypothetical protein
VSGDNQSVLANTTVPESTLKKKSQSIAYHFVRKGCAQDEWQTAYVNTHLNPSDLLTKPLPHGAKRQGFVQSFALYLSERGRNSGVDLLSQVEPLTGTKCSQLC